MLRSVDPADTVPQNIEAEECVLGSIFLEPSLIADCVERLTESDFWQPANGAIFAAMRTLAARGDAVEVMSVSRLLQDRGQFSLVGGHYRLMTLVDAPSTPANIDYYVSLVKNAAIERSLYQVANSVPDILKTEATTEQKIAEIERRLADVVNGSATSARARSVSELLHSTLSRLEEEAGSGVQRGVSTGFSDLDYLSHGISAGELIVIGARPSMGKSALSMQICGHVAKQGAPVVVFSQEMSPEQLIRRMLCVEGNANASRMQNAAMTEGEWASVCDASSRVARYPIYIAEGAVTASAVRAECRRIAKQNGGRLGVVMIDYLQLMAREGDHERESQAIAATTRALKLMAQEFRCTVLLLSQLSRSCEQRPNKRPILSDLRESGGIEENADQVWLLYRDSVYNPNARAVAEWQAEEAEIIIAKHRSGPIGTVTLAWVPTMVRFANTERTRDEG